MNGVIGLTDLLLRTDLDEHQRRLAANLQNSGLTLLGDHQRHPRPVEDRVRQARARGRRLRRARRLRPGRDGAQRAGPREGPRADRGLPPRRAAPAARRLRALRSGDQQPGLERGEVHRRRRGRHRGPDRAADPARRGAARRRHRHRRRHRPDLARPALRGLHPGGPVDHASPRRHRPGPGHLAAAGGRARRRAVGDQRAGHRQHLLLHRPARPGRRRGRPPVRRAGAAARAPDPGRRRQRDQPAHPRGPAGRLAHACARRLLGRRGARRPSRGGRDRRPVRGGAARPADAGRRRSRAGRPDRAATPLSSGLQMVLLSSEQVSRQQVADAGIRSSLSKPVREVELHDALLGVLALRPPGAARAPELRRRTRPAASGSSSSRTTRSTRWSRPGSWRASAAPSTSSTTGSRPSSACPAGTGTPWSSWTAGCRGSTGSTRPDRSARPSPRPAGADHRDDRLRPGGRARALPRGRHGRLPHQAGRRAPRSSASLRTWADLPRPRPPAPVAEPRDPAEASARGGRRDRRPRRRPGPDARGPGQGRHVLLRAHRGVVHGPRRRPARRDPRRRRARQRQLAADLRPPAQGQRAQPRASPGSPPPPRGSRRSASPAAPTARSRCSTSSPPRSRSPSSALQQATTEGS